MNRIAGVKRGFTIVELLVVIVVIAILASITVVSFNSVVDRSRKTSIKTDLSKVYKSIALYNTYNNAYPSNATELAGGVEPPVKKSSFSMANDPYKWVIYCTDGVNVVVAARQDTQTTWWAAIGSAMPMTDNAPGGTSGSTAVTCPLLGISTPTYSTWIKANSGWASWLQ